jgi:hypothetical protein
MEGTAQGLITRRGHGFGVPRVVAIAAMFGIYSLEK